MRVRRGLERPGHASPAEIRVDAGEHGVPGTGLGLRRDDAHPDHPRRGPCAWLGALGEQHGRLAWNVTAGLLRIDHLLGGNSDRGPLRELHQRVDFPGHVGDADADAGPLGRLPGRGFEGALILRGEVKRPSDAVVKQREAALLGEPPSFETVVAKLERRGPGLLAEPLAKLRRQGAAHPRPASVLSHGHERGHITAANGIADEQGRADDAAVPLRHHGGAGFAGHRLPQERGKAMLNARRAGEQQQVDSRVEVILMKRAHGKT